MATTLLGIRSWKLSRSEDGHREYTIKHLVKSDTGDGPYNVLQTVGLPTPGSVWVFASDVDLWAWCTPEAEVTIHQEKEGDLNRYWTVEQKFSTKPPTGQRCSDQQIEDPILEPAKVSGGFTKYTEAATYDRFGIEITSSSHELITGANVEFDRNRPTIKIQQNVLFLELALVCSMVDTVNATPLWGLPSRCVKLSNVSWDKKYYGQCYTYYERNLEFDINFTSFDREVADEGSKVLQGKWNGDVWVVSNTKTGERPSRFNPAHFDLYEDRKANKQRAFLDGYGRPAGVKVMCFNDELGTGTTTITTTPASIKIEKYSESNFLLLGIPTSF